MGDTFLVVLSMGLPIAVVGWGIWREFVTRCNTHERQRLVDLASKRLMDAREPEGCRDVQEMPGGELVVWPELPGPD